MKSLSIFLTFIFLLSACNKATTSNDNGGVNPTGKSSVIYYPHSEEFKKKSHGEALFQDRAQCMKCHGDDLKGGTSKVSCTTCHQSYPHPENWSLQKNHGKYFSNLKETDVKDCSTCHKDTNVEGARAVSCTSCHSAYPHSAEFKEGMHGDAARSYAGKCSVCHTDFKANMPNMGECASCHSGQLTIYWKDTPSAHKGLKSNTRTVKKPTDNKRKPSSP